MVSESGDGIEKGLGRRVDSHDGSSAKGNCIEVHGEDLLFRVAPFQPHARVPLLEFINSQVSCFPNFCSPDGCIPGKKIFCQLLG